MRETQAKRIPGTLCSELFCSRDRKWTHNRRKQPVPRGRPYDPQTELLIWFARLNVCVNGHPPKQHEPDVTSIKLLMSKPTRAMLPENTPATTPTSPSKLFHAIVKCSKCFPRRAIAWRFIVSDCRSSLTAVNEHQPLHLEPRRRRMQARHPGGYLPGKVQRHPRQCHCADNRFGSWKAVAAVVWQPDGICPRTAQLVGLRCVIALSLSVVTSQWAASVP